jgi:steroid delta-isomerase-like uncharacterized protein
MPIEESPMTRRRDWLKTSLAAAAGTLACARNGAAAADCAGASGSATSALLDRYVSAVNAHDTSIFPELFTNDYIQHSGRTPSGLAAQIANFQRIFATMPDVHMQVEDRIMERDKLVARNTYSATHTQTIRGIPPTGKAFTFSTIDIWRVENGKLAEHWDLTDTAEALAKLR